MRVAGAQVPLEVAVIGELHGLADQLDADPAATIRRQHEHVAEPRHVRRVRHHATERRSACRRRTRRSRGSTPARAARSSLANARGPNRPLRTGTGGRHRRRRARDRRRAPARPGARVASAGQPEPAMLQRGQHLADTSELGHVEVREPDAVALLGRADQHATPRVDGHGVAVRPPALLRVAERSPLPRRHHEALVLDRARAEQDLPVVLPRLVLELRRHEQHLRAHDHQSAVELREAEVVADRQAEPADVGLVRHELIARR